MLKDSVVRVRVANSLKEDSEKVLEELGLDMSTAIRTFLIQLVRKQKIPFELATERAQYPKIPRDALQNIPKIQARVDENGVIVLPTEAREVLGEWVEHG